MTLNESVAKLTVLVPKLKASDANFANGLIAAYKKYGSLTPKQAPWVEKLIARAEEPAKPVFSAPLTPSLTNPPAVVNVGDFAGVIALFNKAKEHLKFPKVNLLVNGHKVVLSLNGAKSKKPGFVSINSDGKYGYRKFYGQVSPEGIFTPWSVTATFGEALVKLLTEFSQNPARVAKDHGKLTGHCCFCNKELGLGEDKRSVVVGFGPVCAEHYGLKDQWLSGAAKAEAKASVEVFNTVLPSVQDEVKADLEKGFADAAVLTSLQTDVKKAAVLQQAFLEAQEKTALSNPYPADEQAIGVPNFVPKPTLTVSPKALEKFEQISKNIALVGEAAVKGTAATSGFVQSLAEAAAKAEAAKYKQAEFDKITADLDYLGSPEQPTQKELDIIEQVVHAVESSFFVEKNAPLVTCYFCEQPTVAATDIQGLKVCPVCAEQLA